MHFYLMKAIQHFFKKKYISYLFLVWVLIHYFPLYAANTNFQNKFGLQEESTTKMF